MMHHAPKLVLFPEQPDVLDMGDRQKVLHSPYRCSWIQDGVNVRLTVPAMFAYNGASVPQFLWSIYPPHALDRAAVFHDFIYRGAGYLPAGSHEFWDGEAWRGMTERWTRAAADELFFRHLGEDPRGPGWFRRRLAYGVVRAFGGGRWGP